MSKVEHVIIEYRWADDQYDRLPAWVADLVRRRVDGNNRHNWRKRLIFGGKRSNGNDSDCLSWQPRSDQGGLCPSLNRPGGNATGVITLNVDTGQKRLELIHELVPAATTMGLLLNPTNKMVAEIQSEDLQGLERALWGYSSQLGMRAANAISMRCLQIRLRCGQADW